MAAEGGSTTGVMTERGYYADHAATQRSASTLGFDLIAQAIGDVAAEAIASDGTSVPWRIADLGCAHRVLGEQQAHIAADPGCRKAGCLNFGAQGGHHNSGVKNNR